MNGDQSTVGVAVLIFGDQLRPGPVRDLPVHASR